MSGQVPLPFPTGPGATPDWDPGYVPPAPEWNGWWSSKLDTDDPVFQTGPWMPLAGGTMLGNLVLAASPTQPMEAATKAYVDANGPIAGPFLPMSGGVMTGMLTLASLPVNPFDAAPKQYVDTTTTLANTALGIAQAAVPITGGTMTGPLVLSGDPVQPLGTCTKQYADRMLPLVGGTITGNLTVNGQLQSGTNTLVGGVLFVNPFNGWEWSFGVDANGDKIQSYRTGWYDIWSGSTGARAWMSPGGGLMSLDAGGDLWTAGSITAAGNMAAAGNISGANVETSGEIRSAGAGRIIAQGAGNNPSVTVWDTNSNIASGMFLGSPGLCFGNDDGSGNYLGDLYGYFDTYGNFTASGWVNAVNLQASNDVFANNAIVAGASIWCTNGTGFGLYIDGQNNRWLALASGWEIGLGFNQQNFEYWNGNGFFGFQSAWNGDFYIYGNLYVSGVSDTRTKKNIAPYTRGLAALRQLNPITYEHNGLGGTTDNGMVHHGLSAQALQPIMPECVYPTRENLRPGAPSTRLTNQLSIDEKPLTYAIINAVKELLTRVESLEARVP